MDIDWFKKQSIQMAYKAAMKSGNVAHRFSDKARQELSLSNAAEAMRDDEEVAIAAIAFDAMNFIHLSDRLRDNQDLLLKAAEGIGFVISHASERLRYDRETILRIARIYGCLLSTDTTHDMYDWGNDKDSVLAAIKSSDGGIVESISSQLQDDEDVMLAAARHRWDPLQYASKRLRSDKVFALKVMSQEPQQLCFLCDELRCDPDVVRAGLHEADAAFSWADVGKKLKKDRSFIAGLLMERPDLFWSLERGMGWGCKSPTEYINKFNTKRDQS